MPESPYQDVVYPPIGNLDIYRKDLRRLRTQWEDDDGNLDLALVLDIGDELLAHCDFLDRKIKITKHKYNLLKQSEASKKLSDERGKENQTLKEEIEALKNENEALMKKELLAEEATAVAQQLTPKSEDTTPDRIKPEQTAFKAELELGGGSLKREAPVKEKPIKRLRNARGESRRA